MENESRYYTVSEYANKFNIAESFVREMVKGGRLPEGHQSVRLSDEKSAQVRIWVSGDSAYLNQQLVKENEELKNKITQIGSILLKAN